MNITSLLCDPSLDHYCHISAKHGGVVVLISSTLSQYLLNQYCSLSVGTMTLTTEAQNYHYSQCSGMHWSDYVC